MKVTLYKPQTSLLQKYIECFYTLRREPGEEMTFYRAFPSVLAMVCLHIETKIDVGPEIIDLSYSPQHPVETKLTCNFGIPGFIRYEGPTDEIVIYFKPLGINAFLEGNFCDYFHSAYGEFDPFEDYKRAMARIFDLNDDNERIAVLEDYWCNKYKGFEHLFLDTVVDEIIASGGTSSISDIARRNGISRQTLNKHFETHIGTTPSQFKKIVRFRNAMKRHREKISAENLTDISQNAEYFDQSHMIKDFKSLTQYPPKAFFSKISSLEDGHINWLFL